MGDDAVTPPTDAPPVGSLWRAGDEIAAVEAIVHRPDIGGWCVKWGTEDGGYTLIDRLHDYFEPVVEPDTPPEPDGDLLIQSLKASGADEAVIERNRELLRDRPELFVPARRPAPSVIVDAPAPPRLPDRIGIDANGFGWRFWDGEDYCSMVPTTDDNEAIPQPVAWFVRESNAALALLDEVVAWAGAVDWTGPQMPHDLGRRIATALSGEPVTPPEPPDPRDNIIGAAIVDKGWTGIPVDLVRPAPSVIVDEQGREWTLKLPCDLRPGDVIPWGDDCATVLTNEGTTERHPRFVRMTLIGVAGYADFDITSPTLVLREKP